MRPQRLPALAGRLPLRRVTAEGRYTRTANVNLAHRNIAAPPPGASNQAGTGMRTTVLAGALALTGTIGAACAHDHVQDPHLARNLAATCASCHGTGGRSVFEPLLGQPRAKLLQTLDDFRTGKRDATIMHQIVRGYTDAQLELVADWFSRQKEDGGSE